MPHPATWGYPGKRPESSWDEDRTTFEPRSISVLTLAREGIAEITTFLGPGLLPLFGLPGQIEP